MERYIPEVKSKLRSRIIEVPPVIYKATGIKVLGTRIKSLLFSTDVAVIKNTNANSIIAVYPFTPQLSITQAILEVAPVPVFVGVGGGLTTGKRSVDIALQAELMGAYGVVVNAPTSKEVISKMYKRIDIPIIATIASDCDDYKAKLDAGARILNISGGPKTAEIVRNIREDYGKELPIIATGGPTDESILETIEAGANAITYTPPSSGEVFSDIMDQYRIKKEK
ncbi:hydrolase [Anaerosalibacter bizertensis]|uniref:Hydrolase n=1 Tax=Anaerosalibacter bizertensis TaxID=932217 RepID=A0A844FFK8_9FIRM|nr:hydrolase [Anaerosalibacter bizertensis]MBU5293560.1 hydrolase [Anaerosalibacter bizertensis]MSS42797.1 hydrolase [Anaerosalibacter bizertensis]HHV25812.1 hydrolase [Tissierellia bacterium]